MADKCTIVGCKNFGRYCRYHKMVTIEPATTIKKFSDKRTLINRLQYTPAARQFVKNHPRCEMQLKGCTGKTQGVHHSKGKATIELLLNQKFWIPSCNHCNLTAEIKDAEARGKGLKHSKFN